MMSQTAIHALTRPCNKMLPWPWRGCMHCIMQGPATKSDDGPAWGSVSDPPVASMAVSATLRRACCFLCDWMCHSVFAEPVRPRAGQHVTPLSQCTYPRRNLYMNQISEIPENVFQNLPSLESLWVGLGQLSVFCGSRLDTEDNLHLGMHIRLRWLCWRSSVHAWSLSSFAPASNSMFAYVCIFCVHAPWAWLCDHVRSYMGNMCVCVCVHVYILQCIFMCELMCMCVCMYVRTY
jgi:hypothetical protein